MVFTAIGWLFVEKIKNKVSAGSFFELSGSRL
jgi:hypothetical protein